MRTRTRWIAGVVVVAAWGVAWRFLGTRPEPEPAPVRNEKAPESRAGDPPAVKDPLAVPREPVVASTEPPPPDPAPDGEADDGSPLAQGFEQVTGSFLTNEPGVAELLALSHDLALQSSVDPASVQVEREAGGELRFARGTLVLGDLRGTFLVEEGVYVVRFSTAGEGPWGRRDLQITFQDGLTQATGCQAAVQFHPREDESASVHVAEGEARIVGWGVTVSPESGSVARPLTVGASGDAWHIEESRDSDALEMPWVAGTASFDAWLQLLRPQLER